jgi:catechol 2,3-dioxygenase-like lactoylglutathione lyase family enzyme
MQMSKDREAARAFTEDALGFDRFFYGPPYVEKVPTDMPLGIPRNLTTTVPYKTGIFYPVKSEYGRMEYIEIDGLDGQDYSSRCHAPNLGWLSVTYPVDDASAAAAELQSRGVALAHPIHGSQRTSLGAMTSFSVRSPDGALIEFAERSR